MERCGTRQTVARWALSPRVGAQNPPGQTGPLGELGEEACLSSGSNEMFVASLRVPPADGCLCQGETPKDRAEKAPDPELAAYLGNRQHYQMIQREDQETTV